MRPISLTQKAHSLVKEHLTTGEIAIDATVGNGHDTLLMAQCVGQTGKVYGFDIQQAALEATRLRLLEANLLPCLTLIHANHVFMHEKIPVQCHGKIKAVMFNLGYLPGGDKSVITQTASTLLALSHACQLLSTEGIITILAYPGHKGGDDEADQVKNWCEHLSQQPFRVSVFSAAEFNASSPVLFVINKIS